jgi:hypothetical protein
MNFQFIFCLNAYLFLCWIWKAFKAQVCPHFSNTYYAPNTRQTRPFWIVSLHGTSTRLTICWWPAFLWQIFMGICWIVLISLFFSDVESLGIVTSNAPKLTLRPENRDLYVLLYITIICAKEFYFTMPDEYWIHFDDVFLYPKEFVAFR